MEQLSALIHHVKLHESGWWEKAIQNIIISTIGLNDNLPDTPDHIIHMIQINLNNGIDKVRLGKQFEILRSRQVLIKSNEKDKYLLDNKYYEDFKNAYNEHLKIESNVENIFKNLVVINCNNIDNERLWDNFKNNMLIPLIKDIGAKTYELISGKNITYIENNTTYINFTNSYDDDCDKIRKVILEFLSSTDKDIRNFIFHYMNNYFLLEATNLDEKTIKKIYSDSNSQPIFKIFIDTNFLLTMFDLHDNPSNEATCALIKLMKEIKDKVKIKFYILPITIKEFQFLIKRFKENIDRMRPTISYAKAVEESNDFSGIIKKYFQRSSSLNKAIDTNEYFNVYLEDINSCLKDKNIELYIEDISRYSSENKVLDDISIQTRYRLDKLKKENSLSPEEELIEKEKVYYRLLHDCQLWHIIKDKRKDHLDSPKDSIYWIITLDFQYIDFDRHKMKRDETHRIGLCIHPNSLISMLQFWVPRTDNFEQAILGNIKLPFIFRENDPESEIISIDILRAISYYENVATFSKETILNILTNKVLRQKIKNTVTDEERISIMNDEVGKLLDDANKEIKEAKKELKEKDLLYLNLESKMDALLKNFEKTAQDKKLSAEQAVLNKLKYEREKNIKRDSEKRNRVVCT